MIRYRTTSELYIELLTIRCTIRMVVCRDKEFELDWITLGKAVHALNLRLASDVAVVF